MAAASATPFTVVPGIVTPVAFLYRLAEIKPLIKAGHYAAGVGSHLRYWGMDGALITEADWQRAVPASDELTVHVLPARHFPAVG